MCYFISISTICFHSSPVNLECFGFKFSQFSSDNEFIILRNFENEYCEIGLVII